MQRLIILDYGSQYTQLIARTFRDVGYYSEIFSHDVDSSKFQKKEIAGIILSGGPDSVGEENSRTLPNWVVEFQKPILGICYGLQLLMHHFGGKVRQSTKREFGESDLGGGKIAWMSHGDDVENVPSDFKVTMTTSEGVIAAVENQNKKIIAVQFHPEVQHTNFGKDYLRTFAEKFCELKPNWNAHSMLDQCSRYLKEKVETSGKVLVACSGGVDSAVAAILCEKILGADRVESVLCDTGLLRYEESKSVAENLKKAGLKNLHVVNCEETFLKVLNGVTVPEQKRKLIGKTFIEVFENFVKKNISDVKHFVQGTLYPDVIESGSHGHGAKTIKTHHNVGGLPEHLPFSLVEPFRFLFKDEVRAIGRELGLSDEVVGRHPFPGPGLALRVIGDITKEKLNILRKVDHLFITALRENNLYYKTWQAFAVLLPVKSVGVMGDNRSYQSVVALRAVSSADGMTADVTELPFSFLKKISAQIVQQVPEVNRVVYDFTTKPPATIEWE